MESKSVKVIAEIGSVHDGSFGNALKAIEAAALCGADVVKFQTHIAEAETLVDAPSPHYFKGESRIAYFKRTGFDLMQWREIAAHSAKCGVEFLSSPFSLEAVDLLEEVGVDSYKIPSGEVSNIPLLEKVSATGKRKYLSSGMSNWDELDAAVDVLKRGGELVVMQCASLYPCPPEGVGLNVMLEMKKRYDVAVGFSDHTLGIAAGISAAALGAVLIEKHFTFSRLMYGSDAKHSMEPDDFKAFVSAVKEASAIFRNPVDKNDLSSFGEMKSIFEKSVVTARPLTGGAVLALGDFAYKKPGDGIPAARYKELIGRSIVRDLTANHKLDWDDLA